VKETEVLQRSVVDLVVVSVENEDGWGTFSLPNSFSPLRESRAFWCGDKMPNQKEENEKKKQKKKKKQKQINPKLFCFSLSKKKSQ